MIIRCPQCEHTRSINERKIPSTAELATCPKCKHRFRFRTLRQAQDTLDTLDAPPETRTDRSLPHGQARRFDPPPGQQVLRPQSAVRESAEQSDIWDAVDALHERWQAQLDQHVTEVEQPSHIAERAKTEQEARLAERAGTEKIRPSERAGTKQPTPDAVIPAPSAASANVAASAVAVKATQPEPEAAPDADPVRTPAAEKERPPKNGPAAAQQAMPVVFPYSNGGAKPEERVEHDMQMLRQEPSSRPMRDLGRLKEFPDAEQDAEDADAQHEDIPWENPARYGWARGFMRTVRGAMFNAPALFSAVRSDGSLAPGYLFFLILGYISIIATVAWSQAAALLLPGVFSLPGTPMALPLLLLLAPVALGLMLLFVTGFIKIVLTLFAPEKAVFPIIYRIVAYSVAPFILSVVPFVGPALGALWFLASLILGCRHGLGLSWGLACTAPLLPAAALLGGLVWYFL